MQELKINELQQVSGGWADIAIGAGIAVIIAVASAGYNDGRADKYR